MIYALALFAALASGAPASASQAADAYTPPDKISYQGVGNGWTGGRTNWWIDQSGRGLYETSERGQKISKRLNVGVEGFERLQKILRPLEDMKEMPCDGGGVTDQATGGLTWGRGRQASSLRLDFGCARNNTADAWASFREANGLLLEWTTRAD